jgi:23S rRNA (pseudouridine1915-N3)-methyltransferase
MKICVAWVGKTKEAAIRSLSEEYLKRISRYAEVAGVEVKDEAAILSLAAGRTRTPIPAQARAAARAKERHKLVLLDARGKQMSSEELAQFVEREQISAMPVLFAIGGADGFSDEMRRQAGLVLSLGRMTLPHELARVVLLEQVYRAFTILNHHPYHMGH